MEKCPELDKSLASRLRSLCPVLVLASQSPNRLKTLKDIGISVITRPQDIVEICGQTESEAVVSTLSKQKLDSYMNSPLFDPDMIAIACDTLVFHNGKLIGKPHGESDAERTIRELSGDWHEVYSGLSVYIPSDGGKVTTTTDVSRILFKDLTEEEIRWYISSGDPMGAAGSYRVQSHGYKLIERIEGSFANVIGLPLEVLADILESHQTAQ